VAFEEEDETEGEGAVGTGAFCAGIAWALGRPGNMQDVRSSRISRAPFDMARRMKRV